MPRVDDLVSESAAEVSPNFYSAALRTQYSPEELKMINQMSRSYKTATSLLKFSKDKARKEFLELDPAVQANIRYIFPDKEQFLPEQNLLQRGFQAISKGIGAVATGLSSPIILAFKGAEQYGRGINLPYQLEQKREQGEDIFNFKVLTDTYYGKNNWRWDRVEEYNKKYGVALTTLARGIAEGRTPGEAIDLYGKFDKDMYAAIQFMSDEPKRFDTFMKSIKMDAQVSWGRDVVNKFVPTEAASENSTLDNNNLLIKFTDKLGADWKTRRGRLKIKSLISGTLDGIYQVGIDPLTYVGVGAPAKAVTTGIRGVRATPEQAMGLVGLKTKGEKLADLYQVVSDQAGNASAGIQWAFKQPEVRQLWDEQLGPLVQRYAEAENATKKAAVYNDIKINYPDWANREVVKELARPEVKAFDAVSAENFFTNIDDLNRLLTSRVDTTSYRRYGIPSANLSRRLDVTVEKTARSIFSKTITGRTDDATLAATETERKFALDTLLTVANKDDTLINPNIADLQKLSEGVSFVQRGLERIGTALSRSPGRILFGDGAISTAQDFRNLANQVLPVRVADALTESFLDETVENQITIVRNLYQAVMMKAGMDGSAGGRAHMETILSKTFNELGMGTTTRTEIPLDFADVLSQSAFRMENDVPLVAGKGVLHPSQWAEGIAPLPYDLIYQYGAQSKLQQKLTFLTALGGATRHNIVRLYTDFWANLTLWPRLGIRSAIDEAFFMYMAAPWYNVRKYLMGSAVKPTRVLEAITGSSSSIGMYRRLFYKTPGLGALLDPRKKITPLQRFDSVKKLAKIESERRGYDVPDSEISQALIREDIVREAESIYGDTMSPKMWNNIRKVMKYNPQVQESVVNSLGARSSISGKIDMDYADTIFTVSNLSKVYEDYGLVATKNFRPIQVSKMDQKQVAIAHYRNFSLRVPFNSKKVADGVYVSPATAFFTNNGLRTKDDFVKARNEILEKVGVTTDPATGGFIASNETAMRAWNGKYSSSVFSRQQGIAEPEIARLHVERMLLDMRNTFHGGPNAYNEKLMEAVRAKHKEIIDFRIQAQKEFGGAWEDAAASLTFKEFEDVTVNMHPVGEINTDLVSYGEVKDMKVFEEDAGLPHMFNKWNNWSMEVMDAQVTGLYRQKALWIALDVEMDRLVPYEKMLAQRYKKSLMAEGMSEGRATRTAATHAEKRVTELAWKQAGETVLEYVDNPSIRTNLAISVRSVARFYRATEDFYRRLYRVGSKTPLRTLYRLRLLNTGLDAAGDIYEDDKGDKYIIFPTDTIINSSVEPIMRALTGREELQVPTWTEMGLKLRLINPSFAPDAGQPALAGPIGAVGTLTLQAIVGNVLPFVERISKILPESGERAVSKFVAGQQPKALKLEDALGKLGLGNFADTMTFRRAITPMLFDTFLGAANTLTEGEWDRQLTTAVMQAMRYQQAFGNGIDENATAAEKKKYIDDLKVSASNVIIARTLLGYISPGMPSLRETKELPDFLKRVGITGFKAEFWDIYNGILRNQGEDVGNIYDLAVATYIGKNPGKLIYTVPTTEKEWKTVIAMTGEVKDWSQKNERFLSTYEEMGYIFAPRTGEFNSDVYTYLEAADLIRLPKFKDYLVSLQIAEDREKYFQVQKDLEERLTTTGITQERRELINIAAQTKKDMLTANPYLQAEVNGSVNEQGGLKIKFKTLAEANADTRNPADDLTKRSMQLALEEVASFVALAEDKTLSQRYDFTSLKEQRKAEVEQMLETFTKVNPTVKEAYRVVFRPLLNSYSRDAVQAGAGR
jgi:hypothetical protein